MSISSLKSTIRNLPSSPGVYLFKDDQGDVLYVGKAASLRDRVQSYFSGRNNFSRPIEFALDQVKKVETKETDSVLEAYIKEQQLIRELQPKYNVDGKDDKSFVCVCVTDEKFPRFEIVRKTDLAEFSNDDFRLSNGKQNPRLKNIGYSKIYGPFTSKHMVVEALKIMRRIFPFHSAKQKTEKGCLHFQIGLCPGPYAGEIDEKQYKKNIRGIEMMLKGKKKTLMKQLEAEMKKFSREHKFEQAKQRRDQLFALQHVRDMSLISRRDEKYQNSKSKTKGSELRIEGYDISNISGKFNVGSMVVFEGQGGKIEPSKSQYRKFKIKTIEGADDVGAMGEVLRRRFKNDWPLPDLILLDGGKGHLSMAEELFLKKGIQIPVVAVAKGETRKMSNFKYQMSNKIQMSKSQKEMVRGLIEKRNVLGNVIEEAHRFAISYHRKLRAKEFLK